MAVRVHGWILRLLPRDLRGRASAEMAEMFAVAAIA
jgi:hypothetical protein